jgi:hypothetical protein
MFSVQQLAIMLLCKAFYVFLVFLMYVTWLYIYDAMNGISVYPCPDLTVAYFQEPRLSWGSTGRRWKGIAAVCYCQWFPKYSEFGSEDETRKEHLPLCWGHGLPVRYSLSFGYVSHIQIIPLYHVTVHHRATWCSLQVFLATLPASFMLFFYPCMVFSWAYALTYLKYTLQIELMWCSFIGQKKLNLVMQFWCIQNSLVDFSLEFFFLHILLMIMIYIQAVWMEVLKFDHKMVPLQENWRRG